METASNAYGVESKEKEDALDELKSTVHRRLLTETEFAVL